MYLKKKKKPYLGIIPECVSNPQYNIKIQVHCFVPLFCERQKMNMIPPSYSETQTVNTNLPTEHFLAQSKQITHYFALPSNKAEDKLKSVASDDQSFTQCNHIPHPCCHVVQVSSSRGSVIHFALFPCECHLECGII